MDEGSDGAEEEKQSAPSPKAKPAVEQPKVSKSAKKTPQKGKSKRSRDEEDESSDEGVPTSVAAVVESLRNPKAAKPSPLQMFTGRVKRAIGAVPSKGKK